jgi:hypothetical protein
MMKLVKSDIEFKVNGKLTKFSIYNDLPTTGMITIENALASWIPRTTQHTAKSFVAYIKSKDLRFTVLTESSYNKAAKL